ncbi:MAG: TrkA family potassium uptake protein, partial [Halobacteriales archaeon]
ALDDDTSTMLATLVARELNPEVRILARSDEAGSVGKLYRAGADYVLALATVSGRMLASAVLEEQVVAPQNQVDIIRTGAPALAGRSLAEADVRAETGATVVAVERDGEVITDLSPDFRIEDGDTLVVAGPDSAINRFNELAHG